MYTTRVPDSQRPASSVAARLARLENAQEKEAARYAHLEAVPEPVAAPVPPPSSPEQTFTIEPIQIARWLWAGRMLIVACLLIGMVGAFAVSRVLPPRYTSYADLVIGAPASPVTPDSYATAAPQRDTQLLEFDSRLRVLTSTNVLERTVDALSLGDDPEFSGSRGFAIPFFGPSAEEREADARLAAMRTLYDQVSARRDGQTYVATLQVYSQDPAKSVRIANAVIAAFQEELWEGDRAASVLALEALNERLNDLRARVGAAEEAVETFRRDNGLQGSEGQLLSSQSLGQINTQINDARAALIAAESRHAELVAARGSALSSQGIWDSEVVSALRAEYHEVRRELDAQSAVYGPLHPTIAALQPQLRVVETALNQEIDRIIRTAAADVEQARAVVDRLTAQSDSVRTIVSVDDSALMRLRELQREADVQGAIYEAYLRRMAEINERSQVDVTTVRVISPPLPAASRSWPPRAMVLLMLGAAVGLMIGAGLALAIGLARDYLPLLRRRLAEVSGPR